MTSRVDTKKQKALRTNEIVTNSKNNQLSGEQKQQVEQLFQVLERKVKKEDIVIALQESDFDFDTVLDRFLNPQEDWKQVKRVNEKKRGGSSERGRGGKRGGRGGSRGGKSGRPQGEEQSQPQASTEPAQAGDQQPQESQNTQTPAVTAEQTAPAAATTSAPSEKKPYNKRNQGQKQQPPQPKPKQPTWADILQKGKQQEEQKKKLLAPPVPQEEEEEQKQSQRVPKQGLKKKKYVEVSSPTEAPTGTSYAEIAAKSRIQSQQPPQQQQPSQTAPQVEAVTVSQTQQSAAEVIPEPTPAIDHHDYQPLAEEETHEQYEEHEPEQEQEQEPEPEQEVEQELEQEPEPEQNAVILPEAATNYNTHGLAFGSFGSEAQYQQEEQPSAPALNQQNQQQEQYEYWNNAQFSQQYPHHQTEMYPGSNQLGNQGLFQQYPQQHQPQQGAQEDNKGAEQPENQSKSQYKYTTPYTVPGNPSHMGFAYPYHPPYMMSQYQYHQYAQKYPMQPQYYKSPYQMYPQFAGAPTTAPSTNASMAQYPGFPVMEEDYSKMVPQNVYYMQPTHEQQQGGSKRAQPQQKQEKRQGAEETQEKPFPYEQPRGYPQQYIPYPQNQYFGMYTQHQHQTPMMYGNMYAQQQQQQQHQTTQQHHRPAKSGEQAWGNYSQ